MILTIAMTIAQMSHLQEVHYYTLEIIFHVNQEMLVYLQNYRIRVYIY